MICDDISTIVTSDPKRLKACAISDPIGPPPNMTSFFGNFLKFHKLSLVR